MTQNNQKDIFVWIPNASHGEVRTDWVYRQIPTERKQKEFKEKHDWEFHKYKLEKVE